MAELSSEDKGLDGRLAATQATLHVTLREVSVILHVTDLDRVGNPCSCIFVPSHLIRGDELA